MALNMARLSLWPCHPAHLLTLLEQPERFEGVAGFPAAPGLREVYTSAGISPAWLAALRKSRGPDPWRFGFFVLPRAACTAIGSAGFKGPPDAAATVEIAYCIAPGFEGQGYATEAAAALVAFAFATPGIELVCAHTLPARNASTRVLTKCGFRRVDAVRDPDDGQVWRWERRRNDFPVET